MHRVQVGAGEAREPHGLAGCRLKAVQPASSSVGLVLGIESSCDEMAAAVVRDGREILASRVHGQVEVHRLYGGVVPELASRDHTRAVSAVVEDALAAAGVAVEQLDGVAVTDVDGDGDVDIVNTNTVRG